MEADSTAGSKGVEPPLNANDRQPAAAETDEMNTTNWSKEGLRIVELLRNEFRAEMDALKTENAEKLSKVQEELAREKAGSKFLCQKVQTLEFKLLIMELAMNMDQETRTEAMEDETKMKAKIEKLETDLQNLQKHFFVNGHRNEQGGTEAEEGQLEGTFASGIALAVLLTVKSCGDSVFLVFNERANKFNYEVYAEPPDKLFIHFIAFGFISVNWQKNCSESPEAHRLATGTESGSNCFRVTHLLISGQKISVLSAEAVVQAPVETRVKDGILAQFNTEARLNYGSQFWHKERHKTQLALDDPWWPQMCPICYNSPHDATADPMNAFREQNINGIGKKADKKKEKVRLPGCPGTGANSAPLLFNRFAAGPSSTQHIHAD